MPFKEFGPCDIPCQTQVCAMRATHQCAGRQALRAFGRRVGSDPYSWRTILQRIGLQQQQIGDLPRFHRAEGVGLAAEFGWVEGRRLQRPQRRQTRFEKERQLIVQGESGIDVRYGRARRHRRDRAAALRLRRLGHAVGGAALSRAGGSAGIDARGCGSAAGGGAGRLFRQGYSVRRADSLVESKVRPWGEGRSLLRK